MTDENDDALASAAREIAAPWAESPYYADAERWTFLFWDADRPFRRLFDRLDLSRTVELAVGHGRHAERAAPLARELTLIDVHEDNLARCRERLAGFPQVTTILGDGYSFRPLDDGSRTAIYSYDAMVHFHPELVASYLRDAARVLAPGGRILLHHSNLDAPPDRPYGHNPHARNRMTGEMFEGYATDAGLVVLDFTVIPWGDVADLDRISLLERPA
jgi:SAM-dependent methyltransferase